MSDKASKAQQRAVQWKVAAKAAHGPRGEWGENLPYSIRKDKRWQRRHRD